LVGFPPRPNSERSSFFATRVLAYYITIPIY